VVRLVSIKNYRLRVLDIDIIDKTPLLDIKPYVPQFDVRKANKIGWIKKKVDKIDRAADDGRFCT
ncbi:MAG: SAM-dependent methyltransferase, partial [Deltaproteobacteria bacterium]|nr:SAM-dependent methyltransferase [Deltaproteobacteria bacterium]